MARDGRVRNCVKERDKGKVRVAIANQSIDEPPISKSVTYEKEEMCFEGDRQLDGIDDLLTHVLRYDERSYHYDDWRRYEPNKEKRGLIGVLVKQFF